MICFSYQSPGSLSLILQRWRFQVWMIRETQDIHSKDFEEFLDSAFGIPKVLLVDGIHLVNFLAGEVKYKERLLLVHLIVCDAQVNFIDNGFSSDDAELFKRGIWVIRYRHGFQNRLNRMLEKDIPGIPSQYFTGSTIMDKGKLESILANATDGFAQGDVRNVRRMVCNKLTGVGEAKQWRAFIKNNSVKKRPLAQIVKFLESKDGKALSHAFADNSHFKTRPANAIEFANMEFKGRAEISDLKFLRKILGVTLHQTDYDGAFPLSRKTMRMREALEGGEVKSAKPKTVKPTPKIAKDSPAMIMGTAVDPDEYDDEYSEEEEEQPVSAARDPDDNGDDVIASKLLDQITLEGMLKRDPAQFWAYVNRLHAVITHLTSGETSEVLDAQENDDYMEDGEATPPESPTAENTADEEGPLDPDMDASEADPLDDDGFEESVDDYDSESKEVESAPANEGEDSYPEDGDEAPVDGDKAEASGGDEEYDDEYGDGDEAKADASDDKAEASDDEEYDEESEDSTPVDGDKAEASGDEEYGEESGDEESGEEDDEEGDKDGDEESGDEEHEDKSSSDEEYESGDESSDSSNESGDESDDYSEDESEENPDEGYDSDYSEED